MELTQLRYFQAAARYENITRAAEAMYTSQSSLSKTISRLESELGQPLFTRVGNRIRLNQAGRSFYRCVNQMLKVLDDGVLALDHAQGGHLAVATTIPGILSDGIERYLASHPLVSVSQLLLAPEEILRQFEQCRLDLAVSSTPLTGNHLSWKPLYRDEIVAAVCVRHPLAGRDSILLEELKDDEIVINNAGFGSQDRIERLYAQAGFVPRLRLSCSEPELLYKLVAGGRAVMLTSQLNFLWKALAYVQDPPFQYITHLRINSPAAVQELGLALPQNPDQPPWVKDFCDQITADFIRLQQAKSSGRGLTQQDLFSPMNPEPFADN